MKKSADMTQPPGKAPAKGPKKARIDAIYFDDAEKRQPLARSPLTRKLHTGKVILSPGESVGEHSTGGFEEIVVFLRGSGTARAEGREDLDVAGGMMIYFPPDTRHDIIASGTKALEYVYIVAKTR